MTTHLDRAIRESKEREERIMNIPLENHDEIRNILGPQTLWEPRFREMVEMMREVIEGFVTGPGAFARRAGFIDGDKKTEFGMLMENSEHKACAVLDELERLAKSGLENDQ